MAFSQHPGKDALRSTVWAGLVAILVYVAIDLGFQYHLYATAALVLAAAGLAATALHRRLTAVDRELARFVESLAASGADRPSSGAGVGGELTDAISRAQSRLAEGQLLRHRQMQYLQSLLDAVAPSLLVIDADGGVLLANAAAQRLAGEHVQRLADMAMLGPEAVAGLLDLPPGGRRIIRLNDGRRVLAAAVQFSVPAGKAQTLIALQDVAVELGVVEVKAWQDLVRILAHEMLNSLTPVSSVAESIRTLVDDAKAGTDQEDVLQQVDAAAEIIARRSQRLMEFVERYRKVAETPVPVCQPVEIDGFVAGLDRLMRSRLEASGVALKTVADTDLVGVFDAGMVEQTLINLVANAAEAAAGGAQPQVRLEARQRDGGLEFRVSDNGSGVPERLREHLFVPFFTTKAQGSGVGLSLARQIAQAHQGRLDFHPNAPSGAVFTLALPPSGAEAPKPTRRIDGPI